MCALIRPYKEKKPVIAASAFIAENAVIAGDVVIGAESSIWYGCTLRGDVNVIRIGARSNIQDHSMIHVSSFGHATIIGDDVTVGHMALLHACTLEDGSFVGMKACLMDGALVERGAMVAAGALVTPGKTIPSGQLWGGAPARFMRNLTVDDVKHMAWSSAHYVRLAKEYC
ncbi:MAG: gamma carbonic anhydrase family protein [Alphaproteobacteria bacterium CG_4_9_14_3_um_filter_47_13]|nr:MAG: gamma carbonic anhydrase family protein [Alphaproteobacteria bacterium CG_4_9_14_3_um_filter_47_13]